MPEERGAFADAARKRETQLAQRLATSAAADEEFEAALRGAVQHNRELRRRLDAIESEIWQRPRRSGGWTRLRVRASFRSIDQQNPQNLQGGPQTTEMELR